MDDQAASDSNAASSEVDVETQALCPQLDRPLKSYINDGVRVIHIPLNDEGAYDPYTIQTDASCDVSGLCSNDIYGDQYNLYEHLRVENLCSSSEQGREDSPLDMRELFPTLADAELPPDGHRSDRYFKLTTLVNGAENSPRCVNTSLRLDITS